MRNPFALVAALLPTLLLATLAPAVAAEPPAARHAAWAGTWVLDKARSDPLDQMLDVMEVSWYVRALARLFTPTIVITTAGDGLDMSSETPLGSHVENMRVDGIDRAGSDLLDRSFQQRSRWGPAGALVVDRTTDLPSGKKIQVQSHWRLAGDALTNDIEVQPASTAPFEMHRVFVREKEDD